VTDHEFHEDESLGKAYDARLMRRLLRYLRPHRGTVAVSMAFLVAASLLELIGPLLIKTAIDDHVSKGDVLAQLDNREPASTVARATSASL